MPKAARATSRSRSRPKAALNGHAKNHERDIIPPFEDDKTGSFPGQNWDAEGQEIWGADCVVPEPGPGPSPSIRSASSARRRATTAGRRTPPRSATRARTASRSRSRSATDNFVAPGPSGRGQPTTFQPGRVESAFSVANIPLAVEGSWTVRYGGRGANGERRCSRGLPAAAAARARSSTCSWRASTEGPRRTPRGSATRTPARCGYPSLPGRTTASARARRIAASRSSSSRAPTPPRSR